MNERKTAEYLTYLNSLSVSDLEKTLSKLSKAEASGWLTLLARAGSMNGKKTTHETDQERKRATRMKGAGIMIPRCKNPSRRADCLADPELFLRTYGKQTFYLPFVSHHRAMIKAIHERAKSGGDKAVAGPRGEGKTQIAVWMIVHTMLAELRRFPMILAATNKLAYKIFKQFRDIIAQNDLLYADFPEICHPVRELQGAPQRAAKQHVDGYPTGIVWQVDELVFPRVPGSNYGGMALGYAGLDAAVRGRNVNGLRPDIAIVDDPETRKVAFSDELHLDVEELIDGDVALLGGPDKRISRVILTTVQNRRCYSYRVTNRKIKPAFEGETYKALLQWPTNQALWDEYIARRQQGQAAGDKDGAEATAFYLGNLEAMQAGAEMSNPERYPRDTDAEGNPIVVDALQSFFNQIADYGMARVMAELQNEPEEDAEAIDPVITPGVVQRAIGHYQRNEFAEGARIFAAIDIGKYRSHWVKVAMIGNAIGHVIDYGVAHTSNVIGIESTPEAVEREILAMLIDWRDEITAENAPELCFIDSGTWTAAIYEFVRQVGGIPFMAAKGHTSKQMRFEGVNKPESIYYDHCRADLQAAEGIWLYNFDSVYWKRQVHDRFTLGAKAAGSDGSLCLWDSASKMEHKTYSHHVCAEVWEESFKEGKGVIGKWSPKSKQNHWLDATGMALAASAVAGFRVLPRTTHAPPAVKQPERRAGLTMPDGRPYLVTDRRHR